MRNQALVRVLRLANALRRGRRSVYDLALEFGVTTRTVRRDLEVLSLVGVGVRSSGDEVMNRGKAIWWIES